MKKKIREIIKKKNIIKIVCLTAYSSNMSKILDKYCDIILVGDSLANVLYGMTNTRNVTIDIMSEHAKSVKKVIKKSLCIVDMPYGSYNNSKQAVQNARKILKRSRCDAVKIENNNYNYHIIENLVKSKIPVMGHIGFTPQFKKKFKVEGNSKSSEKKIINQAIKIQKAGAFSIVLECISSKASKKISSILKIPTIGIGSSRYCDGQILVTDDILGLGDFNAKFVKKYINLNKIIEKCIQKYRNEVITKKFPKKINSY
tara:strand:+ start:8844 stop:9617 length:774 start_codon:yes stop_codon:yes gene_type:complete